MSEETLKALIEKELDKRVDFEKISWWLMIKDYLTELNFFSEMLAAVCMYQIGVEIGAQKNGKPKNYNT